MRCSCLPTTEHRPSSGWPRWAAGGQSWWRSRWRPTSAAPRRYWLLVGPPPCRSWSTGLPYGVPPSGTGSRSPGRVRSASRCSSATVEATPVPASSDVRRSSASGSTIPPAMEAARWSTTAGTGRCSAARSWASRMKSPRWRPACASKGCPRRTAPSSCCATRAASGCSRRAGRRSGTNRRSRWSCTAMPGRSIVHQPRAVREGQPIAPGRIELVTGAGSQDHRRAPAPRRRARWSDLLPVARPGGAARRGVVRARGRSRRARDTGGGAGLERDGPVGGASLG